MRIWTTAMGQLLMCQYCCRTLGVAQNLYIITVISEFGLPLCATTVLRMAILCLVPVDLPDDWYNLSK